MKTEQYRAANRFGLGVSSADLSAAAGDPRGWLGAQLKPGNAAGPRLPASRETLAAYGKALFERRQAQRGAAGDEQRIAELEASQAGFRRETRQVIADQTAERFRYALTTTTPFRERLVQFWSNHFTVSGQGKPQILGSCPAYENEAIRTSLDGQFEQMLLRVTAHPVMLLYLDNVQSMGPDSQAGRRRHRGLNENLAREILELHTLGVDGGYTQNDVKALAGMLTGWTVGNEQLQRLNATPGEFAFVPFMHQPGSFHLLGKHYPEGGAQQARDALVDIARHPATAHFLATKLVRHFVSDEPPADSVAQIARIFRDTDGHLPSVHQALIELPRAWNTTSRKLKTPYEFLLSAHRGLELPLGRTGVVLGPLRVMNHLPFSAPSPAGWPDIASHWGSSTALRQRIEWAIAFGGRAANAVDVRATAARLLPPESAGGLEKSLERAASPAQALGMLLASPGFQWR